MQTLNPKQITSLPVGAHSDGGGLYLMVEKNAAGEVVRKWSFRFTWGDKRKVMDIGPVRDTTLAQARDRAGQLRQDISAGRDPRAVKQAVRTRVDSEQTFLAFANSKIDSWCAGLNPREPAAWKLALASVPSLHGMRLDAIDTVHVEAALKPLWRPKSQGGTPATAKVTRQRIEKVLSAAAAVGLRPRGFNPASWRGNLDQLLPKVSRVHQPAGHTSLDYSELPRLMTALRYDTDLVARAIELVILTACRSQEVRLMQWSEVNLDKAVWNIPADHMKLNKAHRVPLSPQAVALLKGLPRTSPLVFPQDKAKRLGPSPMWSATLRNKLHASGFAVTLHGMRTSFRNWCGESLEHNFRREMIEHCLAHREGDSSERAYWTAEALDRRREIMNAWADHVLPRKAGGEKKRPALRVVSAA
jgi:integrase